ncbi:MAG TPA: bifunctional diaminohydroxyphosphoribosylaminopyrimidine deaminase/5-amino-6-(5-phosphoribosylamino)uracil reductase RibD [Nitrospiraceae bacterium]|nr:bifunctional diaminohydroxyphosphoribosylaminopyrimidine deaminase/5-amino-6-(5-phosphoribosylamino)uracil reductase RibD [Nitrospiraceae bacterium]
MNDADRDAFFMAKALRLAAKGRGTTSPNPMVGAVVVSGARVVGQGYHHRAGEPHAEILALQDAGSRVAGAALYVTLEPCNHTNKRTPPCVPVVLASGLRRIVVAMRDPNPQVSGKGIARLRRTGLEVSVGCLGERAARLNEVYCHWISTGRPFVLMKAAMTLDGKIATATGESRWISGEAARRQVHRLRRQVDAIMVGIGTILQDDPSLTVRLSPGGKQSLTGRQPVRVVLDSRLRISPDAQVVATVSSIPTIVVTTRLAPKPRVQRLQARGVTVLIASVDHGRVSFADCLMQLGKRNITSVLLEGGSELNAAALRGGFVNRLRLYIAPMLLGGQDAKSVIGGISPKRLADALGLKDFRVSRVGQDLLLDAIPQS